MTQASEVVKVFSGVFSSVGITLIWTAFAVGVFARWLANSRVKSQLGFLNSIDRSLQSLKGGQALSQGQMRESLEGFFRTYFSVKGGRLLALFDKMLGVEASSWQIVDRLVNLAYDKKGSSATERSRHLLTSLPSLTRFFRLFSLGSFHRIGAVTPAVLVLLGALGTYAGFLHSLPILAGADISDLTATNKAVQGALFRLFSDTGYTILGTVLAIASVLINASWDAERSFQGAVNRLAHVVEFLGNLEKSGSATEKVRQRVEDEKPNHVPAHRRQKEVVAEEAVPGAEPQENPASAIIAEANPFEEVSVERTPRDRIRQRAQVVQAEQDWGPLPLSAVPSPKQKPIRVEPAEVPMVEETASDDEEVAASLRPELTTQGDLIPPTARNVAAVANEQAMELAKEQAMELAKEQAAAQATAAREAVTEATRTASPSAEFVIPETALPADWEDQIRGLKTQLASTEEPEALKLPVEPAPQFEMEPAAPEAAAPALSATNIETPFDDLLERTVSGVSSNSGGPKPAAEDFNPMPDSPTEAELLAMMVPKEWATQRPADLMQQSFDENVTPIKPAETHAAAVATELSAADEDRMAILNHRMDKVQLYLRKANEDLTEGIISQEMFDDESARWKTEIETLTKDLATLTAKRAA